MENIDKSKVIELLENTELIISKTVYGSKLLSDLRVEGLLLIKDLHLKEFVTFSNCHFDQVIFNNVASKEQLEFKHCTFSQDFTIVFADLINFQLDNCQFEKGVIINNCKLYYLSLRKLESQNGINFEAGQINYMEIKPVNEKTHFSLIGKFLLIKELHIISLSGISVFAKKAIINNIHLSGYYNISSRLDFNGIINKSLEINELNNEGKIYFSNLNPLNVKDFKNPPLTDYINTYELSEKANLSELGWINKLRGKVTTLDLLTGQFPVFVFREFIEENYYTDFLEYDNKLSPVFRINDSAAGILELKNIYFERYKVEINNSDLSAVKLINSKIPDITATDNYLSYYSIYNDLYTSANRQNNTKDKVEYYRISQRYLYKHLKDGSTSKHRDTGSLIAIAVSNIYSSHGTDWLKACFVTLLISFLFFCLFAASLRQIYPDISLTGLYNFLTEIFPFFPQFLNPLHKIEMMETVGQIGPWSALFDFVSRIFIGIGIFEIVRAFRKHVR